jgi:opacity protein-like surface antigen
MGIWKKGMKFVKATIASAALLVAAANIAVAGPLPKTGEDETNWRYDLLIYSFLPVRTTGTSTIAGQTVPLDLDLGDVLDLLNWALSGRFEAWRGDFGVILDANYYDLGTSGTLPGPAGSGFDVSIRQKWFGLYGAYRVAKGSYGKNGRPFSVDLQGGVRYNTLKQEINISNPLPIPTLGGDEGWWEPVIGARGVWELNDRWRAIVSADFGGFGAGGDKLQVGANIGAEFSPWENTSLVFGYRYFSMDYSTTLSTGVMAYDVQQHGPVIGLKIRF